MPENSGGRASPAGSDADRPDRRVGPRPVGGRSRSRSGPRGAAVQLVPDMAAPTAEESRNLATVADVLPWWNSHDIEGILRHYDPEIAWNNVAMAETYRGLDEVSGYLRSLFLAFPDLTFAVRHRIAKGGQIAEEWTMRGTHRGEFIGIPPTGRVVEIDGMSMVRMRDGRFLRDDFYFDAAGVMRQLGLLPSLAVTRGPVGRLGLRLAVHRRATGAVLVAAAGVRLAMLARGRRTRALPPAALAGRAVRNTHQRPYWSER